MKKPHKHAVEIHAFADGAEIQYQNEDNKLWYDIKNPSFLENVDYRVKPTPAMAWYRVAMLSNVTITVDSEEEETDAESFDNFIRWLTDRIEYEVTQ